MSESDVLVVAAAGLSTVVIWLGVVIQGRISAALASRH
ncbi:sodium:solute symporter [Rhodopseudomonas parapalustris]